MPKCPPGKIINPDTGRCIDPNGKDEWLEYIEE